VSHQHSARGVLMAASGGHPCQPLKCLHSLAQRQYAISWRSLTTDAVPTQAIDVVDECFCRNQASEQLASAAWINPELGVEFGVANQFKPPASIRITHRNIDWHSMRLILFALTCGLPIGQRHDVIGFAHADHVMRLCRVIKLMVDCVDFEPQSSWL